MLVTTEKNAKYLGYFDGNVENILKSNLKALNGF